MTLSFVYLYLFNRTTRQSLHDLVTRSYVVKADAQGKQLAGSTARYHAGVISLLLIAVFALNIFNWLGDRAAFSQALALKQALHQVQGRANINTLLMNGDSASIIVDIKGEPISYEVAVNDVARAVLKTYPSLAPYGELHVSVNFKYNERINQSETLSVATWQERLSKE